MPTIPLPLRHLCIVVALAALPALASAQAPAVTEADYARAERLINYAAQPLVDHAVTRIDWLDATHVAYVDHDAKGNRLLQLDTSTGKTAPLFKQAALVASLNTLLKTGDKPLKADTFAPMVKVTADGRYRLNVRDTAVVCDARARCSKLYAKDKPEPGVLSPDKRSEAFIRDWNLWVRDLAGGQETQLTRDGVENFGYATDNAGWQHTDNAIVAWSPDSRKIATFQQDQRKTGDMYLVSTKLGHPELQAWKYPLAGDKDVTMIERVIIDVPTRIVLRLKTPPDQHRSTLCDDVSCSPGLWDDVKWAPDSKTLAFASTSRFHKQTWLRIADASTGAVRTAFDETVKTYYESGQVAANWAYLPASNEAVWFSERSDWGQLYLYDLATGKPKRAITTGQGNVTELLRVDPVTRTAWFVGVGRSAGVDPYYQQLWKVSLDGGEPVLLTPEPANHSIALSPDGARFVDTYSTSVTPPVTLLREAGDGRTVSTMATADITRLKAAGWVPPEPITVKARDGKTTLYGLMFKPTNFDPARKYPVIDYVYPGPQTGSVRGRSFLAGHGDNQSLAELGFIVIAIDGMGTPWRSKSFHDTWYADMGDNTLPDQVAGLKELGQRYPWIDLGRVGIWGHSGGGNASTGAMLRYPDFFKVAWSESGNHDNRGYEDDWAEKYHGEHIVNKDGTSNYDDQANANHASKLKGRLMLVHGTLDDNVPPYLTLLVADALIKANKNFDMLMLPNAKHGYGDLTPYVTRRRWDYFVQYLLGATPPAQYQMQPMPAN
ncbi:S9 family peptidase [Xanthomonas citri]|uniref:S9 family peptidase n=2 Tax=Xanthomonas citri TaxID=346 RepID=UPI0002C3E640|nr:S9 family peptidase [Xanthomonas citri]AGI09760.1 Dipeptidyl aminopeptidase [Xanthomonas citri subsp. citri Aw12879]AJZ46060.1 Dipeptidyl aminopeptidase/acylaminoacyl-peptidase [Xanthomonas citri pv. citri]AJZ50679.1 Dipeptidyl aminopeptidase/acylaminoacyl-peptidase [Xanthomonas citri pv. citri]AJZ55300.1 Dipeptidyl aminopeptidase/acylaminoacyl-peptidase [Xanthomonas citri pv. citri]AJZ68091.1 Dipeptidyl aminopeptidase/acylaminoacyl-peptidase [Xanthomonas citri pv. citri]